MTEAASGTPKWQLRLRVELEHKDKFSSLSAREWRTLLGTRTLCSSNHDTVLALDFPHYCTDATEGCGGAKGWCYTFQGRQANASHHQRVAMVDQLAQMHPQLFAETVRKEVHESVERGELQYPNIRVSGSGELMEKHVEALVAVSALGVHVWGFTKRLRVWKLLKQQGIELLFSIDRTSPQSAVEDAAKSGVRFAYTSTAVDDLPPEGTLVAFPLHRGGKVREVVDASMLCPKVVEDFYYGSRAKGWCQDRCKRCHLKAGD